MIIKNKTACSKYQTLLFPIISFNAIQKRRHTFVQLHYVLLEKYPSFWTQKILWLPDVILIHLWRFDYECGCLGKLKMWYYFHFRSGDFSRNRSVSHQISCITFLVTHVTCVLSLSLRRSTPLHLISAFVSVPDAHDCWMFYTLKNVPFFVEWNGISQ